MCSDAMLVVMMLCLRNHAWPLKAFVVVFFAENGHTYIHTHIYIWSIFIVYIYIHIYTMNLHIYIYIYIYIYIRLIVIWKYIYIYVISINKCIWIYTYIIMKSSRLHGYPGLSFTQSIRQSVSLSSSAPIRYCFWQVF